MAKVFIDGQAGTTGLQITERLSAREDIELDFLSDAERKDDTARQRSLHNCDVAILCLPDEAARQAVALAEGQTRIIDASTAFRCDTHWTYGVAEMTPTQRQAIRDAQFVSNPGCYPQGFILFVRPLIEAGIISASTPLRCNAVSGYSGGGRQMIEQRQSFTTAQADALNSEQYALGLAHKHVPEMQFYTGTEQAPIFSPTVAHYYKGMLVNIPLFSSEIAGNAKEIWQILSERYAQEQFVSVLPFHQQPESGFLNATECNDTNNIELMVFGNDKQILLTARYDNLGKGAAGAAVQNLNLMLGLTENLSL